MKKLLTLAVAGLFALGLSANAFASTGTTLSPPSKDATKSHMNQGNPAQVYAVDIQTTTATTGNLKYVFSPSLYTHQNVLDGLRAMLNSPYDGLIPSVMQENLNARLFEYQASGNINSGYVNNNKNNIDWSNPVAIAQNQNICPGRNAGITVKDESHADGTIDEEEYEYEQSKKGVTNASYLLYTTTTTDWIYIDGELFPVTTVVETYYDVQIHSISVTKRVSPIVLDMDGNGAIQASNGQYLPHNSVDFKNTVVADFYGDGFEIAMEWVGPNDGLLVAPKADGSVDMSCIFGTNDGFDNGYEKLSLYDTNKNGVIDGNELNALSVWQDANGNAKVDAGEVKTCAELGITSIDVKHKNYASTFKMNGKTQFACDWWPSATELRALAAK